MSDALVKQGEEERENFLSEIFFLISAHVKFPLFPPCLKKKKRTLTIAAAGKERLIVFLPLQSAKVVC